ncbi:MAG: hypothetical protein ACFFDN_37515 [Candidatus Hodarchaeota archaeon]
MKLPEEYSNKNEVFPYLGVNGQNCFNSFFSVKSDDSILLAAKKSCKFLILRI